MGKPTVGIPTLKMRILCVGKNAHNIHGKTDAYYAWANPPLEYQRNQCAFYAWEKMRIIYVRKTTHIMHGQTQGGNANGKNTHFMHGRKCAYLWESPRILCMGKPTMLMPTHKIRIFAWAKMRIFYVGKPTHNMHGQTHGGNAYTKNAYFMRGEKCP